MSIKCQYEYDQKYKNSDYFKHRFYILYPLVKAVLKKVSSSKNLKVLDVGCGTGCITELFHRLGHECYGIDLSIYGIRRAQKLRSPKICFFKADALNLPFKEKFFDTIFCREFS